MGGTAAGVVALGDLDSGQRERCAAILLAALRHMPSAWHDPEAAREEVAGFLAGAGDRLAFAAVGPGGDVMGWIGCILQNPHSAELHPLVVDPRHQRGGVGTLLVRALEAELRRRGVGAVWLGTDDDFGGTSKGHPFTFYRRMGYAVVGVLPDADGPGRHDILMAKRLPPPDEGEGVTAIPRERNG